MSPENLDKRDLQCGDLAMHEDTRQVQLHLKAYIYLTRKRETAEVKRLVLRSN